MCFLLNLLFDSCYNLDDDEDDEEEESSDTMTNDDIYIIYEHIDCGIDLLG